MKKLKILSAVIAAAVALSCALGAAGCRTDGKYADALKIGSTEIPRTLMPYVSAHTSNTFVAGLLYDTLLGSDSEPVDYNLPDGTVYEPTDEDNYFTFTDRLCEVAGAYPRAGGSRYGWVTFEPTEAEYSAQLQRKNIVKGQDEAGAPIEETDEEFAVRAEKSVPAHDWMEYRFKIREGYSWSDGVAFSANDIVFTFKYILKNAGALASIAYFLDDYYDCYSEENGTELVLKLATNKLSDIRTICSSILILPQHIWENVQKPANEKNLNPVGTGAYKIVSGDYIADSSLMLTFRDDYDKNLALESYGADPIKHITIVCLETEDVMLNAMLKGDIDASLDDLTAARAYAISQNNRYANIKVASYDSQFVTTLAFNVGKYGAFNSSKLNGHSAEVRKAISLALDQQAIIDDVLYGNGTTVGGGLVQRTHPHALTDGDGNYVDHETNVDEANAILDAAGFTKVNGLRSGLSFKILASVSNETIVKYIGERLKNTIGVTVEYDQASTDYSDVIKQSNGASFDMILNTVTFSLDKLLMFDARFGVYANGSPRVWNVTGVYDQTLSELMYSMDTETDIAKQYEKAKAVQQRVAELYVEVPLYCAKNYSVYSEQNFTGWIKMKEGSVLNEYSLKYLKRV